VRQIQRGHQRPQLRKEDIHSLSPMAGPWPFVAEPRKLEKGYTFCLDKNGLINFMP
jgi:hypothetical protein